MANELTFSTKQMLTLAGASNTEVLLKPLRTEILLFDSYVAGTGKIQDESILDDLQEGDTLLLQREPENRFDSNAIKLLDGQNRKVGYIPEDDNVVFARLMDAGKFLTAKIVRMEEKHSFRQINISIYLVDF